MARAELYLADEVFLSGTAAELVPVREIDDHAIGTGEPGPITRAIQTAFDELVSGTPRPVAIEVPMDVLSRRAEIKAAFVREPPYVRAE